MTVKYRYAYVYKKVFDFDGCEIKKGLVENVRNFINLWMSTLFGTIKFHINLSMRENWNGK